MKKVTVLGGGAWGTAIATVLAHNNHNVSLWVYEEEVAQSIEQDRTNAMYLPNVPLSKSITPTTSLNDALSQSEWVFEAVPVAHMRSVLQQAKSFYKQDQKWVVLSKGIEQDTLLLPSQILDDVFDNQVQKAVLMGPSFAKEVVQSQVTAVVAAAHDKQLILDLQRIIATDYFRLFPSEDLIGVQLCAALKNVVTLGIGMLDGAGYGDNTKTFFLVSCLQEIRALVTAYSGQVQTVDGFAGIGDLVLTALGKHSKNLEAGRKLGSGASIDQIRKEVHCVPEGFNTVESVWQLVERNNLHLPLLKSLKEVVAQKHDVSHLVAVIKKS